ncbi:hypothetical protein Tco_0766284 [Tanacetum coccineum]
MGKKQDGAKLNRFLIKGNKVTFVSVQDPVLEPADDVVPEVAPLLEPAVLAPTVETHAKRTLGRELGVSGAERDSMDSMTISITEATGLDNLPERLREKGRVFLIEGTAGKATQDVAVMV